MDVQLFVAINLMAFAAIFLVASLVYWPLAAAMPWIVVNGAVLLIGAAALEWLPRWAGAITGAVFVPFVLTPAVLAHKANQLATRGRMREAGRYLAAAALLHPTPRSRFNARLMQAQAEITPEAKLEALRVLAATATPAEQAHIRATIFRVKDDWQGLLDDLRRQPAPDDSTDQAQRRNEFKPLEVRALGEVGRIDEMARVFEASRSRMSPSDLPVCQMFILAFTGRTGELAPLLDARSFGLDADGKAYWTAVAARAAGRPEAEWRDMFARLAQAASDPALRRRAARQQGGPAHPDIETLTPAATAVVDAVANRVRQIAPLAHSASPDTSISVKRPLPKWLSTPVTVVTLGLVLVVYAIEELNGGSENLRALVDLGALWPQYVLKRGEWWRLVTAMFLHYGPLHVGMNGLMIWVLGRPAEMQFGSLRLLLIYGLGGLVSMGGVLWLMANGIIPEAVLMGASGAIMAVFGGLVARRIVGWATSRDPADGRNMVMLAVVLALQVGIDLSLPQVSFSAHACGFVAGLLIGFALVLMERRPTHARS